MNPHVEDVTCGALLRARENAVVVRSDLLQKLAYTQPKLRSGIQGFEEAK
jgi:hypothetical protein